MACYRVPRDGSISIDKVDSILSRENPPLLYQRRFSLSMENEEAHAGRDMLIHRRSPEGREGLAKSLGKVL